MQRARIIKISLLLLLLFGGVSARLVYLQIYMHSAFHVKTENLRRNLQYIYPQRGSIEDSKGKWLAKDQPDHDLIFTLSAVEKTRLLAIRLSRVLRKLKNSGYPWGDSDFIYALLHNKRKENRPNLKSSKQMATFLLVENIPHALAASIQSRIKNRPHRYPGVQVQSIEDKIKGPKQHSLWIDPNKLFASEIAIHKLERDHYGSEEDRDLFNKKVWLPYTKGRLLKNKTSRQWAFEEERLLLQSIDFNLVSELQYFPQRFPGIAVREGQKRTYPGGQTLSHLIGFLGAPTPEQVQTWENQHQLLHLRSSFDDLKTFVALRADCHLPDDWIGKSGLEASLEDQLRGRIGARLVEVDRSGRQQGGLIEKSPALHGEDIQLTLDLEFCQAIEKAFANAFVTKGCGMFANPKTGEILAYSSVPSYDPSDRKNWDYQAPGSPFLNRPLRGLYPPGSTFKMVLAIGALEEGLIGPNEEIVCDGFFDPNDHKHLRCSNHARGLSLGVEDAIKSSCNVFFYTLGKRKLGTKGIERWAGKFGFGQRTGIELSNELLPKFNLAHPESAAIGKGRVLATPSQLLRFVCALATRGKLPYLRILKDSERPAPQQIEAKDWVWNKVVSGMKKVVESGTASDEEIGLSHFDLAAKTGTAEVGPRDDRKNIAWIVGFCPVDDPQLAFVLEVEDTEGHGGERAGPIVAEVLNWYQEKTQTVLRRPEKKAD